jgi:hypothetical protein
MSPSKAIPARAPRFSWQMESWASTHSVQAYLSAVIFDVDHVKGHADQHNEQKLGRANRKDQRQEQGDIDERLAFLVLENDTVLLRFFD